MPRFKQYNYDQDAMVVINYQEQPQPGTFEHAVHYLIDHKLDLSVFHPKYRNEDTGWLAYDPAIRLNIMFAYSKGIYTNARSMATCQTTNSAAGTRSSRTRKPDTASAIRTSQIDTGKTSFRRRVTLWCKRKVRGQWQLYYLEHNIEKLANYGRMAS